MKIYTKYFIVSTIFTALVTPVGYSKGLTELAEDKPAESDAEDGAAPDSSDSKNKSESPAAANEQSSGTNDKTETAKSPEDTPKPQSAASKALADNLYVSSGFGWVTASRSEGKWKGSGMSDFAAGYRLPVKIMPKMSLWGTYRYAPVAVAGEVDGVSYRGVWEAHNFGANATYGLSEKLNLLGSFELGYVLVYLRPLDNIEAEKKAENNGVIANIGGGADWTLLDKFAAGPRIHIGVGGFTVVQVSGAATYRF